MLHILEAISKGAAGPGLPCSETLRLLLLADMLRQAGSSQGSLQHLPGLTDCAGARGRPWPEPQSAAAPHRHPERGCPEPRGVWGVRQGRAGADSRQQIGRGGDSEQRLIHGSEGIPGIPISIPLSDAGSILGPLGAGGKGQHGVPRVRGTEGPQSGVSSRGAESPKPRQPRAGSLVIALAPAWAWGQLIKHEAHMRGRIKFHDGR